MKGNPIIYDIITKSKHYYQIHQIRQVKVQNKNLKIKYDTV